MTGFSLTTASARRYGSGTEYPPGFQMEAGLKKPTLFSLVLLVLANCSSQQQIIEKATDESVEVILNHLEPYMIKGVPSRLVLEKEFSIDTENEKTAQIGLTEREKFD